MRPTQLLSSVFLLSALGAASAPWSETWHLKAVRDIENVIFARADGSSSSAAASTAASSAAASSTDGSSTTQAASTTTASSKATATDGSNSDASSTATGKTTAKASSSSSTTTTHSNSTKTYGNTVGYGGLSMITPNVYSSASYYKVGNYVTFAWNLTSLSITPSALDIVASCTANDATYTLALNQSVDGSAGTVIWDTGDYQATATLPLLTETYTLIIHEAGKAVSATAPYGGFPPYSTTFAMYTPQPYSNTSGGDTEEFKCVTCKSAASASVERHTLASLFAVVAITVCSFSWFVGGLGVF